MEKLAAELEIKPTKNRSQSTIGQRVGHVVEDDGMWEELRDELTKSGVITSVGIKEITRKYIADRAEKLDAMETASVLSTKSEPPARSRNLLWGRLQGEVQAEPCFPPRTIRFTSRTRRRMSTASTRSSTASIDSQRSTGSGTSSVASEDFLPSLAATHDDENDNSWSTFNDMLADLASEVHSVDQNEGVSINDLNEQLLRRRSPPWKANMTPCNEVMLELSPPTIGGRNYKQPRMVRFSQVQIRHYDSILGDNPSCSSGPSVSIGWSYDPTKVLVMDVDGYERLRCENRVPGKYCQYFVLNRDEREEMLKRLGYTNKDIAQAVRGNVKAQNQRRQTATNLAAGRLEEFVEGVNKRFLKSILGNRSEKKLFKLPNKR